MKLEHILGIGLIFGVSVLLVWIVWACFCSDKEKRKDEQATDSETEDSDSFRSTKAINGNKRVRRKKRSKRRSRRSGGEETTDEESEAEKKVGGGKPKSTYSIKGNNYGLHDPFAEWTLKEKKCKDFRPTVHNYPKSPALPRKDTVIHMPTDPSSHKS